MNSCITSPSVWVYGTLAISISVTQLNNSELTVAMDSELIRRTFSELLRKPSLKSRMSLRVHSTAGINAGSSVTHTHIVQLQS